MCGRSRLLTVPSEKAAVRSQIAMDVGAAKTTIYLPEGIAYRFLGFLTFLASM